MANMSPAYVTDTLAMPNKALSIKYISNDSTKYNARPFEKEKRKYKKERFILFFLFCSLLSFCPFLPWCCVMSCACVGTGRRRKKGIKIFTEK